MNVFLKENLSKFQILYSKLKPAFKVLIITPHSSTNRINTSWQKCSVTDHKNKEKHSPKWVYLEEIGEKWDFYMTSTDVSRKAVKLADTVTLLVHIIDSRKMDLYFLSPWMFHADVFARFSKFFSVSVVYGAFCYRFTIFL